ncbi:MAG: fumarylacetoacetate hydrolase family protein [Gammaproteobacteria bacterium]|nr:fumarylacetoacetate hydrolase family protein [Gammaproteobacteria bacterium]MDH3447809.1 fumarylacetoacetate hydrolase family protein [Gammaproteobacteria bacterium]
MKIATFKHAGERKVGLVEDNTATINPFEVTAEQAQQGIQYLIELHLAGKDLPPTSTALGLDEVTLEAPLPRPRRNLFCVGKNYFEHAHEFSSSGFDSSAAQGAVPEHPIVFSKVPESVTGPGAFIEFDPEVSSAIDYEVELAVIIGKPGRGIARANALDHVWGYTIVNDVTARDLQGRYSQWLIGKSQDTFCPMGPVAVTRDEIDLADTGVRTWVNGEKRQDSNTGLLIFDVPTIIETIAAGVTLLPGDVIATGTPAGVGIGFKPPRYLVDGDVVCCEIDGIGRLENTLKQRTGQG